MRLCLNGKHWKYYVTLGFDDSVIYDEIALEPSKRKLPTTRIISADAIEAFKSWAENNSKIEYWDLKKWV